MLYQMQRKNPYNHKKISFSKCLKSIASTILVFGTVAIISGRLKNHYLIKRAQEQFPESISYYEDEIIMTAQFFEQYGKGDPKYCFELYTQLLWNGYFSKDGNYQYNIEEQDNVIGNYGIKIATGKGDCKNNEDFFCKLMNHLGYHAYQMAGTEITGGDVFLTDYIFGNHVITVVENGEDVYYFDTTNFCSYKKENNSFSITSKNLNMVLNPIASYIYGYSEVENFFQLWRSHAEELVIVKGNLLDTVEYSKALILRKKIEPSLQNICKSIVKER